MTYPCLVLDHDDTVVNSTATVHYPCFAEYTAKFFPKAKRYTLEEYVLKNFDPGVYDFFHGEVGMTEEDMKHEQAYWHEYVQHHVPQVYDGMRDILWDYVHAGGTICVVSHSLSPTPFLYLYFILKMPVGSSRTNVVFFSFLIGLTIDVFSNTPGMHAFACTLAGFIRHSLIQLLMGKDLPEGINPSYKTFGYGGFFRYTLLFVVIHHVALFLIESLTLFDPLFLAIRIAASVVTTTLLICTIEAFNIGSQKSGD